MIGTRNTITRASSRGNLNGGGDLPTRTDESSGLSQLTMDDAVARLNPPAGAADAPRTRTATDLIFVATALFYPAWHWVLRSVMPAARDALTERFVVSAVMIAALLAFGPRPLRRHREAAEQILLFVVTTHQLSLLWRNDLALPYVVATFIVYATISAVFTRFFITVVYSIYCLGAGIPMVFLLGHPAPLQVEWLLGMASVVLSLGISTFRAASLRRTATSRIAHERQLLKDIIETIPDPVFVRDVISRSLLTSNEAGRQVEYATGFDMDAVVRHEDRALSSKCPVEADVEVMTPGGVLSVSLKTAVTQTSPGRAMLVTVMRDVTRRRALEESLRLKILQLEEAQTRVRQLQGMLPICMHCSRIRLVGKTWETLETFVTNTSNASFTHTVCDVCMAQHYPAEGEG